MFSQDLIFKIHFCFQHIWGRGIPTVVGIGSWGALPSIYVTAAGWWAGNTQFTFVLAGVGSGLCTRRVVTATWSVTEMNTISILWAGMH